MAPLLRESIRAIKPQAKSGNVEIVRDYPAEGIEVNCDDVRLKQVFINVLSNAVKFTPAGGQIAISAALEQDGGLCIAIKDSGIGMTASEIEAAFEKFRQIDNSLTKRFQGTGLGLPLAKQLIELHGGTIEVSSEPGVGTEVASGFPQRASLPRIPPKRAALPALTYAARPAQPAAA